MKVATTMTMPPLRTDRLAIRLFRDDDLAACAAVFLENRGASA
jgi:hypothetical protein